MVALSSFSLSCEYSLKLWLLTFILVYCDVRFRFIFCAEFFSCGCIWCLIVSNTQSIHQHKYIVVENPVYILGNSVVSIVTKLQAG